jgi:hypothetical protein
MIHTDGLAVKDRTGKVRAAMYGAAVIIEYYRMQAVGGLIIIPSLLNNSGVWTEIDEKTVLVLEELQNSYARRVLHVPLSTPKVSLR